MTHKVVSLFGVAGRYATALFELASEKSATEDVAKSLASFQAMIDECPELLRLVKSPVFTVDEQQKALRAIFTKTKMSGIATNFIQLVAAKRRLFVISDMIEAYRRLNDQAKGIVAAEVTVAAPLRPDHASALRQALASVSGGKFVNLDVKTDPSIIDGVIVKLGSRMVDASVRTKLNAIRTRMKEVG
ncbi:ATP synthase subunit delta [Methylocystaceae bacterium]|nr:ATP synthase subunit delta [Methylocystaceae bacterium]